MNPLHSIEADLEHLRAVVQLLRHLDQTTEHVQLDMDGATEWAFSFLDCGLGDALEKVRTMQRQGADGGAK